jgi:hypothetical protein
MSLFLDSFVDDAIDDLFFSREEKWEAASSQERRSPESLGEEATARLVGMLQGAGLRVHRETPITVLDEQGWPRTRLLDVVAGPRRPPRVPRPLPVYESKYIGNPTASNVESEVRKHAREAQEKQQGIRALNLIRAQQGFPPLSEQVRLIYQLPSDTPRAVAERFQDKARIWAHPVPVNVIMPGSKASRAPLGQVRPGLLRSRAGWRQTKTT